VDERDQRLIEAAADIEGAESIFDALDSYLDGLDMEERRARLDGVWLQAPVEHAEAKAAFPSLVDQFDILQGDVIRTDAAYLLGERRSQHAYVVGSATCDSVVRPKPRQNTILLLPVVPIVLSGFGAKTEEGRQRELDDVLDRLTRFATTRALYLPALPGDADDVVFNTISFKDLCVMEARLVPTVQRVASMSLVGWRAFNLLVRALITRTGDEEVGFRLAVHATRAA
jgi:hypothetical protein